MRLLAICLCACVPANTEPDPNPVSTPPVAVPPPPADVASTPASEPPAPAPPAPAGEVRWDPDIRPLSAQEREAMTGVSWREGCPVPLDELVVIDMPHHTPGGGIGRGELVLHRDASKAATEAFEQLWSQGFVITSIRPVRNFDGDDDASMSADNTSAFNCRPKAGGTSWSMHAFGRAIDVNPLRNPYVRGERVDPPEGRDWLERDASRPGVMASGSPQVQAFLDVGWKWGGHWRSAKDYQHFSPSGH